MKNKILMMGSLVLVLAGCATSASYIHYTSQHFLPKDPFYTENVYSASQPISTNNPYYVIGKVSIEGFASNGVTPETLSIQAKAMARKRGADAIINAQTQAFRYYGGDALLRFTGDLIVYASGAVKS